MALIGSIGQFDDKIENVEDYLERLGAFITANNIHADKQASTLLALVGPVCYKILKSLLSPDLPSTKTFGVEDTLKGTL